MSTATRTATAQPALDVPWAIALRCDHAGCAKPATFDVDYLHHGELIETLPACSKHSLRMRPAGLTRCDIIRTPR